MTTPNAAAASATTMISPATMGLVNMWLGQNAAGHAPGATFDTVASLASHAARKNAGRDELAAIIAAAA